ncbi:hypothetical protein XPU_4157, partial [Xanthomonas arboricola pv. pruni str. MAFF 311562]
MQSGKRARLSQGEALRRVGIGCVTSQALPGRPTPGFICRVFRQGLGGVGEAEAAEEEEEAGHAIGGLAAGPLP